MSIGHPAKFQAVSAIVHEALFLSGKRPVFQPVTLVGGALYLPGTVLGRVTTTGKLKVAKAAAGDGSQNPYGVLCEVINAFGPDGVTPVDMSIPVLVEGALNLAALLIDPSYTEGAMQALLRVIGIQTRRVGYSG